MRLNQAPIKSPLLLHGSLNRILEPSVLIYLEKQKHDSGKKKKVNNPHYAQSNDTLLPLLS